MWTWFHRLASPKHFYTIAGGLIPWLGAFTALLFAVGLFGGLILAPPDYQQGESYRIIFVHVPAASLSMMVYVVMAVAAAIGLVWKIKMAEVVASASAPIGAWFTFLALITGSLWGKPMWGTYWVWDGRLTSELILLFLYLGFMALQSAFEDRRAGAKASAILALVGVVNIPIIKFSVDWWATLHQPATISKLGKPSMDPSMLTPLLIMWIAFVLYYATTVLMRARCEVLERERNATWVKELALGRP
jgi:heme exporter protein C